MSNKRSKGDDDSALAADEIIGIETTDGGKVWYFHRSTLVNAGGYFAARFGEGNIPAGSERTDEYGRCVYFIERDGDLFGKHIRPYILTSTAGDLPPFSEAPRLWRLLREEATYYALDGLTDLLHVTHVCNQNDPLGRGVLHYLGTNKNTEEYQNPLARGAITVGGWPEMSQEELEALEWPYISHRDILRALSPSSLQILVQYRPDIKGGEDLDSMFESLDKCHLFDCDFSVYRSPVVVDLMSVSVSPKAYSLRFGTCYGACNWNFEGSEDGTEWIALHKARNDLYLRKRSSVYCESFLHLQLNEKLAAAERDLRHTWNIPSPKFFRYFRIIGLGREAQEELDQDKMCIHVVGLEIFGDIHEE